MAYEHLKLERHGHVTVVTFNRPHRANAVNYDLLAEIEHCALAFREDAETRVVIFTGAGRHFSSGADLTDFPREIEQPMIMRRRRMRIGERALHAVLNIEQITIAAWNGAAIGGGGCLVTAMDFRVGADDCYLFYPEIDLGLNLMWQSLPLTIRLAGPSRAKRLVIGGERVGAETLLAWGMLEEIAPAGQLMDRTFAFAETYARKSPIAAQMIKRSANQVMGAMDRALMHADADQQLLIHFTEDRRAAAEAYRAKAVPVFKGE